MSYFWYSMTGRNEVWKVAPSEQRQTILSNVKPGYVTVLDSKQIPQEDWSREDWVNLKYSGPLYFDWDGTFEDATRDFRSTLVRLVDDCGVDPGSIYLYATGGKGYHIEIPQEVFMSKVPPAGTAYLPAIYRQVVLEFVTPTLDLKVYSGRKGRMWRVPNVDRGNGRYKVQISYHEALAMDDELYVQLTSAPRAPLQMTTPKLSSELMSIFLEKKESVSNEFKRASKFKDETRELVRFGGEIPPSVKLLMAGLHLKAGVGFNNIALQLALTARALGKTEDQFIEACKGLIQSHTSDGRYNSPGRREAALRERFWYTNDNPCYSFSFGGIRSICEEDFEPEELRPAKELMITAQPEVPDVVEVEGGGEGAEKREVALVENGVIVDAEALVKAYDDALPAEVAAALRVADRHDNGGIVVTVRGIYHQGKNQEFPTKLSSLGITHPNAMRDAITHKEVGLQVNLTQIRNGKARSIGRAEITGDVFASRTRLDTFLSGYGGGFVGTDIQATQVRMALKDMAQDKDNVTWVLHREGVDVISDPDKPDDPTRMLIWVSEEGCVLGRDLPDSPQEKFRKSSRFAYRSLAGTGAMFKPDVINLSPLTGQETGIHEWAKALTSFNDDFVVANMLGWFVSCWHRQVHNRLHGQFPILQIYGAAGSGKTSTPKMLSNMFWGKREIQTFSATRGSLTNHSRRVVLSSSASVPALIDEFKKVEMGEHEFSKFVGELRTSYNSGTVAMGGIRTGAADADFRTVTEFQRSSPICLMTETLVDETAFMERCVIVPMSPASQKNHKESWELMGTERAREYLARLGALLLWQTLKTPLDTYFEAYTRAKAKVQAWAAENPDIKVNERPATNLAIVICGLEFLASTMRYLNIPEAAERLQQLETAVFDADNLRVTSAPKPEIYKALSDIAWITNNEETEHLQIVEGRDYAYTGEDTLDMDVRSIFVKYISWCKSRGIGPFYTTVESFLSALRRADTCTERLARSSPLRRSQATLIMQFSVSGLWAADVEPFKSKLLTASTLEGEKVWKVEMPSNP